jgi:hypothetical protein
MVQGSLYSRKNKAGWQMERLKIKIFNREICVCALLATNSFMRKKQRRNGVKYEKI